MPRVLDTAIDRVFSRAARASEEGEQATIAELDELVPTLDNGLDELVPALDSCVRTI